MTKLRLLALFLVLADLVDAPDLRVEREVGKIAHAFWNADWWQAAAGLPPGKATSRSRIETVYRWFEEIVIQEAGLTVLDPQRSFTEAQRAAIWFAAEAACGLCGQPLREAEAEYDHIVPWIGGGRTSAEDGRAVHRHCNRSRGARDEAA